VGEVGSASIYQRPLVELSQRINSHSNIIISRYEGIDRIGLVYDIEMEYCRRER